jgi:phosphoglycerate dehydrogenase-like enzyme
MGFGMRVIVSDPFFKPDPALPEVENVPLETLMRNSDVVSMACILNEKTQGMITRDLIAVMKPCAYFINVARAALVDEKALYEALQNGKIAGAGLDVLGEEPINPESPFPDMKNVVITPHIGGASSDIIARQTQIMVDGLLAYLDGKRPANIFNPEVLPQ